MKIKGIVAACALAFAGTAMAGTCTSSQNLGAADASSGSWIGNGFGAVASFTDCYSFTLSSASDVFGGVMTVDTLFNKLDISISSLSLFSGSSLVGSDSDSSALNFDYGTLAAGSYRLEVAGNVTKPGGYIDGKVGYLGGVVAVAAPVPEPEAFAMALAGFFGVGGMALRRRKGAASA